MDWFSLLLASNGFFSDFYALLWASICFCMLLQASEPSFRLLQCLQHFGASRPGFFDTSFLQFTSPPTLVKRWQPGSWSGIESLRVVRTRRPGVARTQNLRVSASVNVQNSVGALVRFLGDSGSRPRRIPALTNWSPASRGCTVL